jgi:hypothetical protein
MTTQPDTYRRQIEPPKSQTRTVVLREWLVCVDDEHWYIHWGTANPKNYQQVHPTGLTRTVEVPID